MKLTLNPIRIALVATIAFASACASSPKNPAALPAEEKMGPSSPVEHSTSRPGEVYGPQLNEPLPAPAGASGNSGVVSNPDRIVLVLGPGLAHGYSYVGVIKAISDLKIPIHAIYGSEVGALVGALYFSQPNPNKIDWALLRLNEKNLRKPEGKLAVLNLESPEHDLDEKLKEIFGEKRMESYSDRLHILLEDKKTGEKFEAKSGDLWRAVRGALAGANGFSPIDFEGRAVHAATRKVSEEYSLARQAEGYPVVVVLAGAPPADLFRKLIEEQKSTLLYVPLPGLDNLDVKRRNQAVFAGKNTVRRAANELLGLVGRKVE